jgi:hypothetical protein
MSDLFVVLGLLTFSWMNVIAQSKTQERHRHPKRQTDQHRGHEL